MQGQGGGRWRAKLKALRENAAAGRAAKAVKRARRRCRPRRRRCCSPPSTRTPEVDTAAGGSTARRQQGEQQATASMSACRAGSAPGGCCPEQACMQGRACQQPMECAACQGLRTGVAPWHVGCIVGRVDPQHVSRVCDCFDVQIFLILHHIVGIIADD